MMTAGFQLGTISRVFYSSRLFADGIPAEAIRFLFKARERSSVFFTLQDIRPMTPESLPAVVGIEKLSHGRPWSETSFLAELDNPYSILNLLWHGSALAGYICYHILLPELFILNLTTAPSYRRRGGARFLLNAAIASGVEKQVSRMSLEVRESNQAAISLYSACGFHCLARRKRFYSDGEDALVMERFLS